MLRLVLFIFCIAFLFAPAGWFKTGMVLYVLNIGLLLTWVGWVVLQGLLDKPMDRRCSKQANFYAQEQTPE